MFVLMANIFVNSCPSLSQYLSHKDAIAFKIDVSIISLPMTKKRSTPLAM